MGKWVGTEAGYGIREAGYGCGTDVTHVEVITIADGATPYVGRDLTSLKDTKNKPVSRLNGPSFGISKLF